MGRGFCTVQEAARSLGKSVKTVQRYVAKGYLRKETIGGRILINREDVTRMAAGADDTEFNKTAFLALGARVRSLEEKMAVVQRALEIRDDPLRPTGEEAMGLLVQATKSRKCDQWVQQEIETWAMLFDRMDEVTFDSMAVSTGSQRPWEIYYSLCIRMMDYVSVMSQKGLDVSWNLLHKRLDEGRKKMRGTILVWMEMNRGLTPQSTIDALSTDKEELARRLASKKN